MITAWLIIHYPQAAQLVLSETEDILYFLFLFSPFFYLWLFLAFLRMLELSALTAEWSHLRRLSRDADAIALYEQINSSVYQSNWLFRKTFGRYFIVRLESSIGMRRN